MGGGRKDSIFRWKESSTTLVDEGGEEVEELVPGQLEEAEEGEKAF